MTTPSPQSIAEVGCPLCGDVLSRVCRGVDRGVVLVVYRSRLRYDWERTSERTGNPIEVRPWDTAEVNVSDLHGSPSTVATWPCACGNVQCTGRFVLERSRVRQLLDRARALGDSIRWRPSGANLQRSDRLWPWATQLEGPLPEPRQTLLRLAISEPPPLGRVRVTGVHHQRTPLG